MAYSRKPRDYPASCLSSLHRIDLVQAADQCVKRVQRLDIFLLSSTPPVCIFELEQSSGLRKRGEPERIKGAHRFYFDYVAFAGHVCGGGMKEPRKVANSNWMAGCAKAWKGRNEIMKPSTSKLEDLKIQSVSVLSLAKADMTPTFPTQCALLHWSNKCLT